MKAYDLAIASKGVGWKEQPLPIERIIVGPHKEKESRAAALRVFLRNTNIEISVSDIPFVGSLKEVLKCHVYMPRAATG